MEMASNCSLIFSLKKTSRCFFPLHSSTCSGCDFYDLMIWKDYFLNSYDEVIYFCDEDYVSDCVEDDDYVVNVIYYSDVSSGDASDYEIGFDGNGNFCDEMNETDHQNDDDVFVDHPLIWSAISFANGNAIWIFVCLFVIYHEICAFYFEIWIGIEIGSMIYL